MGRYNITYKKSLRSLLISVLKECKREGEQNKKDPSLM